MRDVKWTLIDLKKDSARWEQALTPLPYSFSHTREHCRAHHRKEECALFYATWAEGRVACPIVFRDGQFGIDVSSTTGYSGFIGRGDLRDFPVWWREFATSRGWLTGYFAVNPWLSGPRWQPEDGLYAHNALFALDLTLDESTLWQNLSRTRRRQIRAWGVNASNLVTEQDKLLSFIHSEAEEFYERIGAEHGYRLDPEAWEILVSSADSLILGVRIKGQIVAVTLFGKGCGVADAMYNISLLEGRDAATSLMWCGAMILKDSGYRVLNMGGGLSPVDSIAESKRRFGCDEIDFCSVRQVYNRDRYEAACAAGGWDPSDRISFFPAYRTKSEVK